MVVEGGLRAVLSRQGRTVFEGLLRDAVTGMAVLDLQGRFALVNPAMARLVGRAEEEIVGMSPEEITHPDDRSRSREVLDGLADGRITTDQRHKRYLRPDGAVVPVVRTVTVLSDRERRPLAYYTQAVDLTDISTAEESLRRSERRFRALVARASDLTLLLDSRGRIVYASPASVRLLGCEPSRIEGRYASEFLDPESDVRARASLARHNASPDSDEPTEYRVRHRNGEWRDVLVVATNLLADPCVGAIVLNVRDVTEERRYRDRLEDRERRFRALVGNSWDVITLHDVDGRYLYCSPAVTAQLGYSPEELIGTSPFDRVHSDDFDTTVRAFEMAVRGGSDPATARYRFPDKGGEWRWLESTAHNRLDDPAVAGIVVTTRDVTTQFRRAAQQDAIAALSSAALRGGPMERLLGDAVALVRDALAGEYCSVDLVESPGTLRVIARAGPELMVGTYEAQAGSRPLTLSGKALLDGATVVWPQPDVTLPRVPQLHAAGLESGAAAVIAPSSGPPGTLAVYSRRTDAFSGDDVSFIEAAANVLAAALTRGRIEDQLRHQALHDHLTGLPNRVLLIERLQAAIERMDPGQGATAALFVDLDNFKLVNDTLGHTAGDRVVGVLAERIAAVAVGAETVSRFGGDEFVVVWEGMDTARAEELAEQIRQAVSAPVDLAERQVTITASIGIALADQRAITPDDLLARADTAMHAAKESGKDCAATFSPQMRDVVSEHLETVSGIRRALANEEFRLVYQPILDSYRGRDIGCEALLRWHHPLEGLLGPDQFIGYAEASGLIVPLGEWVLSSACRQSTAWRRAGLPGRVSVNVSGLQLADPGFVSTLRQVLESSGADPPDVFLEVSENAVMADLDHAASVMAAMRRLGVRIGMDDFGTGRSSLAQLARLPFDFVKIDRSFVQHAQGDRRTAALLEAVGTLCRALDIPAIAEGVETEQQHAKLKKLGVPFVQGFLFGRPVAPAEIERRWAAAGTGRPR